MTATTRAPLLIVVLAAGKGERMRSSLPKVLHPIGGRSMLGHVLATACQATDDVALVVGPGMEAVRREAEAVLPRVRTFEQELQAGTADAVLAAEAALARHAGDVVVLFADTPLLEARTLQALIAALNSAAIAVAGFTPSDPAGYGRLILDAQGRVVAIREHNDAGEAERRVLLCNAGAMAFRVPDLAGLLKRITNANAKREFYLTDAVSIARGAGLLATSVTCTPEEAHGVNSRAQLAEAEAHFQRRARTKAMHEGASLLAPETVYFSFDTVLGRDVTIEPNVFFGPGVVVEDGAQILANSHLVGARIGAGARVGPFARLRPGAVVAKDVHIGNFVELKNAIFEEGAKANHLAYIGDARVGKGANIGAGTIFCNYDGIAKYVSEVGQGAFIGSNSSLVAPVKVGEGAYVAAGSVITKNVGADALAIERSKEEQRPGWAAKFRARQARARPARGEGNPGKTKK